MPNQQSTDRCKLTVNIDRDLDSVLRRHVMALQDRRVFTTLSDYAAEAIEAKLRKDGVWPPKFRRKSAPKAPARRAAKRSEH